MGFGGTTAEANCEVEIVPEREGAASAGRDTKTWSLGDKVGDCSMEPYLLRHSCF